MTFRYPFFKICPSLAFRTCMKMLFTSVIFISVSHNPIVLSRNIYFLTKMTFASITVVLDVISSDLTTCGNLRNNKNGLRRQSRSLRNHIRSRKENRSFCLFVASVDIITEESVMGHQTWLL